jgi:hypothetical protein
MARAIEGPGRMPRLNTILLLAVMGLAACSPSDHKAKPLQAKQADPAAAGHSPLPVQNVGRADLFHGYRCDSDCSVHQAGYAWASSHKITDASDCKGTSQEFIEGCLAFTGIEGPMGEREIFQDED